MAGGSLLVQQKIGVCYGMPLYSEWSPGGSQKAILIARYPKAATMLTLLPGSHNSLFLER